LIARALKSPEVVVPPELAEGLVAKLWEVMKAEGASAKDRISAGRAIVLCLEYNRRVRRDALSDTHHLERLGSRAAESSLHDPEVRAAMARARMRRLAPPGQKAE
jgi:hypothetical protein